MPKPGLVKGNGLRSWADSLVFQRSEVLHSGAGTAVGKKQKETKGSAGSSQHERIVIRVPEPGAGLLDYRQGQSQNSICFLF
jgi:hypothetical protein